MKLFRIFTILCLFLFASFAFSEEGIVKSQDIRIILNESGTFYIKPEIELDIKKFFNSGNTLESSSIGIYLIFEF